MQKTLVFVLFLLCVTNVWSQKKNEPVKFDPTVKTLDEAMTVKTGKMFYVGKVTNGCEGGDTAAVGYTRTGLRALSPLVSESDPATAAKNSLINVLKDKKIYTSDPSSANYTIEATVLKFKLEEESKFLHQTMKSTVAIEVKITDPYDTARVHKFKVESLGERTAFDTTKHAGSVMRQALQGVISEVLKSMNNL
ncbi:MAG: hypothetical protein ACLFVQ_14010 [Chitinispirillaceae bacterium]